MDPRSIVTRCTVEECAICTGNGFIKVEVDSQASTSLCFTPTSELNLSFISSASSAAGYGNPQPFYATVVQVPKKSTGKKQQSALDRYTRPRRREHTEVRPSPDWYQPTSTFEVYQSPYEGSRERGYEGRERGRNVLVHNSENFDGAGSSGGSQVALVESLASRIRLPAKKRVRFTVESGKNKGDSRSGELVPWQGSSSQRSNSENFNENWSRDGALARSEPAVERSRQVQGVRQEHEVQKRVRFTLQSKSNSEFVEEQPRQSSRLMAKFLKNERVSWSSSRSTPKGTKSERVSGSSSRSTSQSTENQWVGPSRSTPYTKNEPMSGPPLGLTPKVTENQRVRSSTPFTKNDPIPGTSSRSIPFTGNQRVRPSTPFSKNEPMSGPSTRSTPFSKNEPMSGASTRSTIQNSTNANATPTSEAYSSPLIPSRASTRKLRKPRKLYDEMSLNPSETLQDSSSNAGTISVVLPIHSASAETETVAQDPLSPGPPETRNGNRIPYYREPDEPENEGILSKLPKWIHYWQRETLILPAPFLRIVCDMFKSYHHNNVKIQRQGVEALRVACEDYMISVFENVQLCRVHTKRATATLADLRLSLKLMDPDLILTAIDRNPPPRIRMHQKGLETSSEIDQNP